MRGGCLSGTSGENFNNFTLPVLILNEVQYLAMQIRVTFVFNKLFSRHGEFKTDFLVNEYEVVTLSFKSDRASGDPEVE